MYDRVSRIIIGRDSNRYRCGYEVRPTDPKKTERSARRRRGFVVMVVVITSRLRVRVPKLQDQEGTRAAAAARQFGGGWQVDWQVASGGKKRRRRGTRGRRKGRAGTGDERQIYHTGSTRNRPSYKPTREEATQCRRRLRRRPAKPK